VSANPHHNEKSSVAGHSIPIDMDSSQSLFPRVAIRQAIITAAAKSR
jgi:hypothetical protein